MSNKPQLGTRAVWSGEEESLMQGATQVPVVHSVSFGYRDLDKWLRVALGQQAGHIYSRNSNPTVQVFEEKLRCLEDAQAATSAATGMGIISSTLFALLAPGRRVVSIKDTYGGTSVIFDEFLAKFHVDATLCDTTDHEQIEGEIARGCQVVYLESPTNPTTKVLDIERLARAGHAAGAIVIVDNTFATPINQNPIALGADLVIHSATKYLGGHNDLLAGAVVGSGDTLAKIENVRGVLGGVSGPHDAYLLLRGLKTLELRVQRQNENGMQVARFLEGHPSVQRVYYPGLRSHPDYEVARRQMTGFSGVVSFEIKGDMERTGQFIDGLRLPYIGPTLGGVESIAQQQAIFISLDPEERRRSGIGDNLVRYALGIEDADDIIADLEQALTW
jgi:cystathionine gamma-synthase